MPVLYSINDRLTMTRILTTNDSMTMAIFLTLNDLMTITRFPTITDYLYSILILYSSLRLSAGLVNAAFVV